MGEPVEGHQQRGEGDVCEDGHPIDAVLQFRRRIYLSGGGVDLSADSMDLAYAMSWAGKGLSRTLLGEHCLSAGVDVNTDEAILMMAFSRQATLCACNSLTRPLVRPSRKQEMRTVESCIAFDQSIQSLQRDASAEAGTDRWRRFETLRQMAAVCGADQERFQTARRIISGGYRNVIPFQKEH